MMQARSLEIYQMAGSTGQWDMSHAMASNPDKKEAAEKRAVAIYNRLMALPRPSDISSNNAWTDKAGVSTSFFTNMQGKKKAASEPSIGNLRSVLEAAGSSLPEFFLHEAQGRVIPAPTKQALEQAIEKVLPRLPKKDRAEFLAEAVIGALGLRTNPLAIQASDEIEAEAAPEEASPPAAASKRA